MIVRARHRGKPALLFLAMLLGPAPAGTAAAPAPVTSAAVRPGSPYLMPDGSIRIVSYRGVAAVVRALDTVFTQQHPGARFAVLEGDNYSSMASLTFNTTAVAPLGSRFTAIGLGDNLKIAPAPLAIRIAHASLSPHAQLSPLAIIVNSANPLKSLTMAQVKGIFAIGAATGDLTRWNQLGVAGDLAHRVITPFGPPPGDYYKFQDPQVGEYIGRKLGGLNLTHAYRQVSSYREIGDRVAADPAAIGITSLNQVPEGVRVVGLAGGPGSNPATGSRSDIQEGRYPLNRYVYLYLRFNRQSQLDPFAVEYARTALSSTGQHAIAAESDAYIPLNSREVAQELSKLER